MLPEELLDEVTLLEKPEADSKSTLWPYLESVHILRDKGYSWAYIVRFVTERAEVRVKDPKTWAKHLKKWRQMYGK